MDSAEEDVEQTQLGLSPSRQQADLWALVLAAEGISSRVAPTPDGFALCVESHRAEGARRILATWARENRKRPEPAEARLPEIGHPAELVGAYAIALCLLLLYWSTEGTPEAARLIELASADARRIVLGDWWRVVTALCLHRDALHVAGNTLIGGLFLAALTHRTGLGVALLGALLSGALGNLANAIYYGSRHDSIGASTAVFGVVGVLSGLEAWRRQRLALPWRGAWVPLGGGLALLAMLGAGGGRTDFGAHIFGFLAGIGLGLGISPLIRTNRPGLWIQLGCGATSCVLLVLAWSRALA